MAEVYAAPNPPGFREPFRSFHVSIAEHDLSVRMADREKLGFPFRTAGQAGFVLSQKCRMRLGVLIERDGLLNHIKVPA